MNDGLDRLHAPGEAPCSRYAGAIRTVPRLLCCVDSVPRLRAALRGVADTRSEVMRSTLPSHPAAERGDSRFRRAAQPLASSSLRSGYPIPSPTGYGFTRRRGGINSIHERRGQGHELSGNAVVGKRGTATRCLRDRYDFLRCRWSGHGRHESRAGNGGPGMADDPHALAEAFRIGLAAPQPSRSALRLPQLNGALDPVRITGSAAHVRCLVGSTLPQWCMSQPYLRPRRSVGRAGLALQFGCGAIPGYGVRETTTDPERRT